MAPQKQSDFNARTGLDLHLRPIPLVAMFVVMHHLICASPCRQIHNKNASAFDPPELQLTPGDL